MIGCTRRRIRHSVNPLKPPLDQIGIVKMPAPHKCRGMVAPLALRTRVSHAHGPEEIALATL